ALIAFVGAWGPPLAALAGLGLTGAVCRRWYRRRLGGFTGDTLGAAQQFGELAAYLGALAVLPVLSRVGGAHG
ncbi:MAG TPA: adenosylcobinamide-GDP ribazoletransferase, partial [Burkholderiaceae bacterium]|nr:adenosylcobinamide-GDP ribazoletransferase [Burkholderiaceae bacterium]